MNQSTLRLWTDDGRVPVFLTPGGHRRYREPDLLALVASGSLRSEDSLSVAARTDHALLASLLLATHERYEVVARDASRASLHFREFDEATRRQFRLLGSSLLRFLSAYVVAATPRERDLALARGREVAGQYGQASASAKLSLVEATEAFVRFRLPVFETVTRWLRDQPHSGLGASEVLERVSHFMDEVLLQLVAAHEQGTKLGPASAESAGTTTPVGKPARKPGRTRAND